MLLTEPKNVHEIEDADKPDVLVKPVGQVRYRILFQEHLFYTQCPLLPCSPAHPVNHNMHYSLMRAVEEGDCGDIRVIGCRLYTQWKKYDVVQ
jgi:hypothetical protein